MSTWNVPESDIVGAIGDHLETEQPAVLATIVRVAGSAYRRPGTKMLLPDSGDGLGSVTAGCVEAELTARAQDVLDSDSARIERFDLTSDDDVWGLGIGCNGVIDILLEPLTSAYRPLVDAFEAGEPISLVTVFDDVDSASITARGWYQPELGLTTVTGTVSDDLSTQIMPALETATAQGTAETLTIDDMDVFIDGNRPPPRLLVFGHGHDVAPVVDLAKQNGFRVDVVSFRGGKGGADRFPDADRVRTTSPGALTETVAFDSNTYVVIMSHNFVDDRLVFEAVLETPVPYIGLLGPRKRFDDLLADCDDTLELTQADADRIYTPIGVDLGSETPYQIAHSIVAELLAVHNDREVTHLRERDGPIHDRVRLETDGESTPDSPR